MTIAEVINEIITKGLERFGRYYSIYRGYVADNEDPLNCGRVQLAVPEIYGSSIMKYWAWPRNVLAAQGFGVSIPPPIGTMVWVEFEKGSPRRPVWSHVYFAKDEMPDELKGTKIYGIKTPAGHLVLIDDDNGTVHIKIKDGVSLDITKNMISLGKDQESSYKAVLGDNAKKEWEKERDRLTALINAIQNATTTSQDGGAALKASIVAAMAPYQIPNMIGDYSNSLSDKVTLE